MAALLLLGTALTVVAPVAGLAGPASAPTPPPNSLDMSMRSEVLGIEVRPPTLDSLGLGPVKPPMGSGSTRMPSATTEIGRGVYLTVTPSCIPGVDEPLFPARRPTPRR
jgi:hypothetical protein